MLHKHFHLLLNSSLYTTITVYAHLQYTLRCLNSPFNYNFHQAFQNSKLKDLQNLPPHNFKSTQPKAIKSASVE